MNFGKSVRTCLGKYATFEGRASRSEFWWFYLFTVVVIQGSLIIAGSLASLAAANMISLLINLTLLVPGFASIARRLHDTDRSGWWALIPFTIIGIIPFLIWLVQKSDSASNQYGPPPTEAF